jgi:DNA repair exonuclease SbcCD ATPase subunit
LILAVTARAQPAVQDEARRLRAEMQRLQERIKDLEAQLKKSSEFPPKKDFVRPTPPRGPSGFGGGGGFGMPGMSGFGRFDSKEMKEQFDKARAEFEKAMKDVRGNISPQEMKERFAKMQAELAEQLKNAQAGSKELMRRPSPDSGPRSGRGGPSGGGGPSRDRDRSAKVDELLTRIIKDLEQLRQELKR